MGETISQLVTMFLEHMVELIDQDEFCKTISNTKKGAVRKKSCGFVGKFTACNATIPKKIRKQFTKDVMGFKLEVFPDH